MDRTKIEWTDATWNPVTGCDEVSPGCDHCYAKTFAERWRGTPGHAYVNGFDVTLRAERLDQPLRWAKPRRIFVNSMSDLFHADIPDAYIAQVFAVMAVTPRHTYQVLTKRHGRMRSLLSSEHFPELVDLAIRDLMMSGRVAERNAADAPRLQEVPLPNVWLGVSVEDQQRADLRIPHLLDTPATVRFLSCEPLLGSVHLDPMWLDPWRTVRGCTCAGTAPGYPQHESGCGTEPNEDAPRIQWVIVGGESGHGARPMSPAWARTLRDECVAAGVAFHFKQWGEWEHAHWWNGVGEDMPAHLYGFPTEGELAPVMRRVGKRHAGRELDGRTWDEYPDAPAQLVPS